MTTLWYVVWVGELVEQRMMGEQRMLLEGIVRGGLTAPRGYNTKHLAGVVTLAMRGGIERRGIDRAYRDLSYIFPPSAWKIKELREL